MINLLQFQVTINQKLNQNQNQIQENSRSKLDINEITNVNTFVHNNKIIHEETILKDEEPLKISNQNIDQSKFTKPRIANINTSKTIVSYEVKNFRNTLSKDNTTHPSKISKKLKLKLDYKIEKLYPKLLK